MSRYERCTVHPYKRTKRHSFANPEQRGRPAILSVTAVNHGLVPKLGVVVNPSPSHNLPWLVSRSNGRRTLAGVVRSHQVGSICKPAGIAHSRTRASIQYGTRMRAPEARARSFGTSVQFDDRFSFQMSRIGRYLKSRQSHALANARFSARLLAE